MDAAEGGLATLAIAIFAGCLLGIAALMIIHKMIDGDFPFAPGMVALIVDFLLVAAAVKSQSPAIPGTIFVVALASMGLFPFAAHQLEQADLRQFQTERMIKAYNAFAAKPDNMSAVFEISKILYEHGLKANAIGLATAALNSLSQRTDSVSNRSLRDIYRAEEQMLKSWNREAAKRPIIMRPVACPKCGHVNPVEYLICAGCGAPYLLEIARGMTNMPMVYGRLLITFALLSAVIVAAAAIGVMVSGMLALILLIAIVAGAGVVIHKMFKGGAR